MSGGTPILDLRRFALLRLPGDEPDDSLPELVRSFAESSAATIEEIVDRADAADWTAVAALAHRLKGGSAIFGALRLRDASETLEKAAADGLEPDRVRSVITELVRELEAARLAMERELERSSPGQ